MRCSISRLRWAVGEPAALAWGNSIKEGILHPPVTIFFFCLGSFSLPSSRVHQKGLVEGKIEGAGVEKNC